MRLSNTLVPGMFNWEGTSLQMTPVRDATLVSSMEQFLAQVEKKAYRMAQLATQSSADALDIVQDAMIKLVEKYAHHPAEEWKPLFYRILQRRITDHFRRKQLHKRLFFWKSQDDEVADYWQEQVSDGITPERELSAQHDLKRVLSAIQRLPLRQQQCLMLRNWEGLSVSETALAMGCSEGSVKTHYSRAREALQAAMQDAAPQAMATEAMGSQ